MASIPGKKTLVGLAAAGLLLVGTIGTALAGEEGATGAQARYQQFVERLATALGKQPDEVKSAITSVHSQYIDEAVAAGKIPADKAQALKDRSADGGIPLPFFGGPGHHKGGHMGRAFEMKGTMGEVTAVNGQTVTIKAKDGSEKTVLLTDATVVQKGHEAADAGAITVGAHIAVAGEADAQGVVTAEKVHVMDGQPGPKGPRPGRGGHGSQPPAPAN